MAKRETELLKWQEALTKLELIKKGDEIKEFAPANWAEIKMGPYRQWAKGTLIFTKDKLVFMSTFGVSQLVIEYGEILAVAKKFPMNMVITVKPKPGKKPKKQIICISKTAKWVEYLAGQADLPLQTK